MPDIGTGEILGAGAFIVVVLRTIFDFIGPRLKRNGHSSGEKDPDFWRLEFRAAVREVMAERNVMLEKLVREAVEGVMDDRGK